MGLKDSGHISQIWIDPKDSDTVLVAAQGPLWNDGGDRGLYKTTDGGKTWNAILTSTNIPASTSSSSIRATATTSSPRATSAGATCGC